MSILTINDNFQCVPYNKRHFHIYYCIMQVLSVGTGDKVVHYRIFYDEVRKVIVVVFFCLLVV